MILEKNYVRVVFAYDFDLLDQAIVQINWFAYFLYVKEAVLEKEWHKILELCKFCL